MKNLRSYLANGIPSPSCSQHMGTKPKRVRTISERQARKALRRAKRGEKS